MVEPEGLAEELHVKEMQEEHQGLEPWLVEKAHEQDLVQLAPAPVQPSKDLPQDDLVAPGHVFHGRPIKREGGQREEQQGEDSVPQPGPERGTSGPCQRVW
jgi:hypothetical protein